MGYPRQINSYLSAFKNLLWFSVKNIILPTKEKLQTIYTVNGVQNSCFIFVIQNRVSIKNSSLTTLKDFASINVSDPSEENMGLKPYTR